MRYNLQRETNVNPVAGVYSWTIQNDPMLYGLLLAIGRAIVDRPQDLHVVMHGKGDHLDFSVQVAEKDLAALVGTRGCNARAIRAVAVACAHKMDRKVTVSFSALEPNKKKSICHC